MADAFRKRGDLVTIYDRAIKDNGPLQWGRLVQESKDLLCAMQGQELVVHLASNADISLAVSDPDIDFREGTDLARRVLEAMRKCGVHQLIYASGSGVYGEYHGVPFKETDECRPTSPYGASKLAGEAMIRAYCHMFDMRADVFRFANVVGPRQTHGVGYDFIRRLKADPTRLKILGDGTQRKSYVHIDDVVRAVTMAYQAHTTGFNAYNVATDDAITVEEIAHMAVRLVVEDGEPVTFEHSGGDRGWKGDVPVVALNTDKIKRLGWRPVRTSEEAMHAAMTAMIGEL